MPGINREQKDAVEKALDDALYIFETEELRELNQNSRGFDESSLERLICSIEAYQAVLKQSAKYARYLNSVADILSNSSEMPSIKELQHRTDREDRWSNGSKITRENVEDLIDNASVEEEIFHGKQLVVSYQLENEYCIVASCSVAERRNPDFSSCRSYCREEAVRKLWELKGYVLHD